MRRAAYSGFHAAAADINDNDDYFLASAPTRSHAWEKTLAMLFDLAACQSDGDQAQPPECIEDGAQVHCQHVRLLAGRLRRRRRPRLPGGTHCSGTCLQDSCTAATCAAYGFNCGSYS